MKTLGSLLLGLFVIVGLFALLRHFYVRSPGAAAAALAPIKGPVAVPVRPVVVDHGPITLEGTAIMDTSTGIPAVPYIRYTDAKGHVATKQLIFDTTRGCNPGAGDVPCVPSYSVTKPYPTLTTGEHIRVQGYIREDRFLIDSITAS